MGIAISGFSGLFAPLQGLVHWLLAGRPARRQRQTTMARPPALRCAGAALPQRKPLRVVHVVDPCHTPAGAGRMVISGRMADVCAELDRLAALEAAKG